MPPKKKVPKYHGRLVRNLNDLYQDEALGSGMMRRLSRSPSVVPSGSSGATGRKSAPSPVAAEESSSSEKEEEEHEVQHQDDEVQGREEEEEEEEEEAGAEARPKVYVRGHSTLPERPILPVNRPIIRPEGTR
jgi:cobalamin biosynthesis protein CobT